MVLELYRQTWDMTAAWPFVKDYELRIALPRSLTNKASKLARNVGRVAKVQGGSR
jgi:hypothetical protein